MHICIVERDEYLHEELALAVRGAGHEVASAYNSTAAIHLLGTERFDLLMIGLSSSLLGGYSGVPMIRKLYPELAIVVLTDAATSGRNGEEALKHASGANEVLAHPVTLEDVLALLERKANGSLKAH